MTFLKKNLPILFFGIISIPFLLNQGLYFDDWTVYSMDFEGLAEGWSGNGMIFPTYLFNTINQLPAPIPVYRITNLTLWLAAAYLLHNILTKLSLIKATDSPYILLLFLTCPLYSSRIFIFCMPYTICLVSFMAATLVLIDYTLSPNKGILKRTSALLLFLFSFIIASHLVLYFVVIAFLVLHILIKKQKFYSFSDFFILPLLFWVIRKIFMTPYGLHAIENYNHVSIAGLIQSPVGLFDTIRLSFFGLFEKIGIALTISKLWVIIFFTIAAMLIFLFHKIKHLGQKTSTDTISIFSNSYDRNLMLMLFGLIVFLAGAFPYVVVSKTPTFFGFNTRHQLLLALGVVPFLVGFINYISKWQMKNIVYSILISAFSIVSIDQATQLMKEWFRMDAIVEGMKRNTNLTNAHTVIVKDSSNSFIQVELSQCVTSGMFKKAMGMETALVIVETKAKQIVELHGTLKILKVDSRALNIRDWIPQPPDRIMKIKSGSFDASSLANCIKLLKLYYTDEAGYLDKVKNAIDIQVQPIDTSIIDIIVN
jgi:hypothetical protein